MALLRINKSAQVSRTGLIEESVHGTLVLG